MNEREPVSIKSGGILNSLEKQLALARRLEKVYENRPDPRNFIGAMAGTKSESLYTKEKIEEDEKYVNDTKAAIEKSNKEKGLEILSMLESGFSLSEMMQAMVVDRINNGMLPHFKAIMTSERDDLKVGMDAIFKSKDTNMGASWDFTASSNITIIQDKLEKVWKNDIKKHEVPVVKYYEDPDTHKKGSLLVPKFIVGCSKEEIEFFAQKYLEGKESELNDHPLKYLIINQIDEQLQFALKYFKKNSENPSFDFIDKLYRKIDILLKNLKQDVGYDEYTKTSAFLEYQKNSRAYSAMSDFFDKKDTNA